MQANKFSPGDHVIYRFNEDFRSAIEVRAGIVLAVWYSEQDGWQYAVTGSQYKHISSGGVRIIEKDMLGPYTHAKFMHYVRKEQL